MIKFDSVTKQYPDGTQALDGITFEVEEGTTTVLVGPSGCGKTTTMKLVNRLEEPTSGTVYYGDKDTQEMDKIKLRRQIGYVIQEIGLFDHMTIKENISVVPDLLDWNQERIDERVDELLELMSLGPEFKDQYPNELSGGQKQRVGVARALASDPEVLLMDEPFGALDPITRDELQDEFLEIQERINTTIIFVTHSINEALKMGDKIAIYDVGKVVQYGDPLEILENPANEFVEDFLGENRRLKQLGIAKVSDVMENGRGDVLERGELGKDRSIPLPTPSTSLRSVLIDMVEAGEEELPVVQEDEVVGRISETAIRQEINPEEPN